MKSGFTTSAIAVLTVMIFALSSLVLPETAEAKWHDNSGDLPGMGFPTGLVIAGAVVAVAGITYLIVKKSGNDDGVKIGSPTEDAADEEAQTETSETEATTAIKPVVESSKVSLFVNSDLLSKSRDYEDTRPSAVDGLAVHAGLTFSF